MHEPKPLLRGWLHAIAAVAALGATIGMLWETSAELPRVISVMIFGLSMLMLYVVSATYHLGCQRRFLRAFDHANIFVLIAGTYTPICVIALAGGLRIVVLVGIWLLALLGAGTTLLMLCLPRWLSTSLYIGLGWIVVLFLPDLIRRVPLPGLLFILGGGLVYTLRAVIYAARRPNPWPRVFGYHELFHLCVIVANAAFVLAIWGGCSPCPRAKCRRGSRRSLSSDGCTGWQSTPTCLRSDTARGVFAGYPRTLAVSVLYSIGGHCRMSAMAILRLKQGNKTVPRVAGVLGHDQGMASPACPCVPPRNVWRIDALTGITRRGRRL